MKKLVIIVALTTLSALTHPYSVFAAECVAAPSGVRAATGPGSGQVTISWDGVTDATSYAIVYGINSGSYIYGGNPVGEASSRRYTVNALQPGARYYFRLIAKRGTCPGPWSGEVQAVAGTYQSVYPVGSEGNMMVGEPKMQVWLPQTPVGGPALTMKAGPVGNQKLWAKSGPRAGEATLYWQDADSANDYHLMYGTQTGTYNYGALNIGNTHWFTVGHLRPGQLYYFALVPLLNGRPLYTTPAVAVSAYMSLPAQPAMMPQVMELTPLPTPTPTPAYQGGTMYRQTQQSLYDDEGEYEDEYEDKDEYGDVDQYDSEDDDNDQGYMMNQQQDQMDDSDSLYEEQMAQQYVMDPQDSRTGAPIYDPLFE